MKKATKNVTEKKTVVEKKAIEKAVVKKAVEKTSKNTKEKVVETKKKTSSSVSSEESSELSDLIHSRATSISKTKKIAKKYAKQFIEWSVDTGLLVLDTGKDTGNHDYFAEFSERFEILYENYRILPVKERKTIVALKTANSWFQNQMKIFYCEEDNVDFIFEKDEEPDLQAMLKKFLIEASK